MGAWIETDKRKTFSDIRVSHPTWVRGLKQNGCVCILVLMLVAPYVGAWIETITYFSFSFFLIVAPYVGAWIETRLPWCDGRDMLCRTLRGCVD